MLKNHNIRVAVGNQDYTAKITGGITGSNVDPGGHEACSFTLGVDAPEIQRGQLVKVEAGLSCIFIGYVSEVGRSLGAVTRISCVGGGAALKWQRTQQIYVDRNYQHWEAASAQRRINLYGASFDCDDPTTVPDSSTGSPQLATTFAGPWARTHGAEAWYDSQGAGIGGIYYAWKRASNDISAADTNWNWHISTSSDDVKTAYDDSGQLRATGPSTGFLNASAGRMFGMMYLYYGAAAGASGTNYGIWWQPAVYGTHGLPGRGSGPYGFYPGDIAGHAAGLCSAVQIGQFDDSSSYMIQHSEYRDGAQLEKIIDDAARYCAFHWGTWEPPSVIGDPRPAFHFRQRAQTATCVAQRADFSALDMTESLDNLYDAAIVSYQEPSGKAQSFTVALNNPILQAAGISGKTIDIAGGTLPSSSAASALGSTILGLLYSQARQSGRGTMIGTLSDGRQPYLLKAGLDRLRIVDLPGGDAWGTFNDLPIKRVEWRFDQDGMAVDIDFGFNANLIETLQAQLDQAAVIAGV